MGLHLFIARHEEAEPGHSKPDRQRSLTGFGRQKGRATGRLLVERADPIDTILTSPLVRAVQTAEIYAGALGLDDGVMASEIVAMPPSVESLVDLALCHEVTTQGLLMVGHQPTLGTLVSRLIGGEYPRSIRPGTVIALDVDRQSRRGTFRWAIEGVAPAIVDHLEA